MSKEGYLMKLGHVRENWNKRYFVSDGEVMQYFADNTKKEPKGIHTLDATSRVEEFAVPGKSHCFVLIAPGESKGFFGGVNDRIVMQASSPSEMMDWIRFFKGAINRLKGAPSSTAAIATSQDKAVAPAPAPVPASASVAPVAESVQAAPAPPAETNSTPAAATIPVILILGSGGSIGKATITSVREKYADTVSIRAGVRDANSDEYASLRLPGVKLVTADLSKPETLAEAMLGVSVVYVIAPGTEDRGTLAIAGVKACVKAAVSHVVVLSVTAASFRDQVFGSQFATVEDYTKSCGLPYTIVRFPFFMDNYLGQVASMVSQGQFYTPLDGNAIHNDIATCDAGEAVATILSTPATYANRILVLGGPLFSEQMVADAFSASLGKHVQHIQVPPEASKASMIDMGVPEWQADGIVELYNNISAKFPVFTATPDDLTEVLGHPPLSIREFAIRFGPPPLPKEAAAEVACNLPVPPSAVRSETAAVDVPPSAERTGEADDVAAVVEATDDTFPTDAVEDGGNSADGSDPWEGAWVLKREGESGIYHNRFVWINREMGCLHWSKVDNKAGESKSISLAGASLSDMKEAVKQRRASFLGTADTGGYSFQIISTDTAHPIVGLKFGGNTDAVTWRTALSDTIGS